MLVRQVSLSGKCQVVTSRLSWSYLVNRAQECPGCMILHFDMCETDSCHLRGREQVSQ